MVLCSVATTILVNELFVAIIEQIPGFNLLASAQVVYLLKLAFILSARIEVYELWSIKSTLVT